MTDIFQVMAYRLRKSKFIIIIAAFSLAMLGIGINHFYEDYLAGLSGILVLEQTYELDLVINKFTYSTMAISPQIAQVIFTYVFLTDIRKNKAYALLALVFFLMDFVPDIWYRSNGDPFESIEKFIVSGFMTFSFFTIGSELFITVGGGTLLEVIKPAKDQLFDFLGVKNWFKSAKTDQKGDENDKKPKYVPYTKPYSEQTNQQTNKPTNGFPKVNWRSLAPEERRIISHAQSHFHKFGELPTSPTDVSKALYDTDRKKGYVSTVLKKLRSGKFS